MFLFHSCTFPLLIALVLLIRYNKNRHNREKYGRGGRLMLFGLKYKNILFILLGTAIMSFGLVNFNMQNKLAEGGFTGITLLLYGLFKWDPSYTNLLLNIPVFFIGWKL